MTDISYFILQLSLNDFRPAFVKTNCKSISSASPTKQGNLTQTDTHLSVLLAERINLTGKLFSESLGSCEWTWKFASDFCVSLYLTNFFSPYQSNYRKVFILRPPELSICLILQTKKKTRWALRCCLMVLWFGIVDSLKVLRSIFINIYSLFCSSIYQFYSWIMWYMHISSSPNTSNCHAFLKRHFSHSLVSQLF